MTCAKAVENSSVLIRMTFTMIGNECLSTVDNTDKGLISVADNDDNGFTDMN